VRAVVGAVEQRLPVRVFSEAVGNLMRTTNLPLVHCAGGYVDHVPFAYLHSTFEHCTVTTFGPSGWGWTSTLGSLDANR
jgi:hypothetical protein